MRVSTHPTTRRRGFSLTVVLLFLLLLMYLWAVVFRTTSSLVRVQTARVQRDIDDAAMRNALAQALLFMEHDAASEEPTLDHGAGPRRFTVKVTNDQVARWTVDDLVTFVEGGVTQARFTVTFTPDTSGPAKWTVEVSAYDPSVTEDLPAIGP